MRASNTIPLPFGSGCPYIPATASSIWGSPTFAQLVQSRRTRTTTLPTAVDVSDVAVVVFPFTCVFVYRPVTSDGEIKKLLFVEDFSDAFMTVNHRPLFVPSVHGGGSGAVLSAGLNDAPTHTVPPL